MVQYRFEVYDFAHYSDENHEKLDAMTRDGWRIHSCVPNFAECAIMWERGRREEDGPASTLPPGFAGGAGILPDEAEDDQRPADPGRPPKRSEDAGPADVARPPVTETDIPKPDSRRSSSRSGHGDGKPGAKPDK